MLVVLEHGDDGMDGFRSAWAMEGRVGDGGRLCREEGAKGLDRRVEESQR